MEEIKIYKDDVLKGIYFIVRLTQNQEGQAMYGSLSGKSDFMGGIFDRFINTLPESIIFNKGILPSISKGKNVEVITDFYFYNPQVAGIAPDLIGLRVNGKAIPFVQFNEKWIQVEDRPLIELKTFKKKDYMVSLRNQNYDNKYLVMVESNFNIDYLVPFFDKKIFDDSIYQQMLMDDKTFIVSNEKNIISKIAPVKLDNDCIGTVSLLKITRSDSFMGISTHCEGGVSVEWFKNIEEIKPANKNILNIPLKDLADKTNYGLYRYNENWYDGISTENIPYKTTNKKSGAVVNQLVRTLDFYVNNINSFIVLKKNKGGIIVKLLEDDIFNGVPLKKDSVYRINYFILGRESNPGEEYFLQKCLVSFIPSFEDELKNKIAKLI